MRYYWNLLAILLSTAVAFAQPISHQNWQSATISSDSIMISCADLRLAFELGHTLDEQSSGRPFAVRGDMDYTLRSAHPVKVKLSPQSGTADNLSSITGCTVDGAKVELATANSGDTITVLHTPGAIEFADGLDVDLDTPLKILVLERKAGIWVSVGLGGGGGGGGGSGDITAVGDCVSGDCGRFTLSGNDKVDARNIVTWGSDRGLIVTGSTDCSSGTTPGQLCNQTTGYTDLYMGQFDSTVINISKNQQAALQLTPGSATPYVDPLNKFWYCSDDSVFTDFKDYFTNDHSNWTKDFDIQITAADNCGINFAGSNIKGNNGISWTANVGDSARCHYSVYLDKWSCSVNTPSSSGATTQESSTIVRPSSATTDWIRVAGDTTAPALGSTASGSMKIDLDNDQVADCTITKSGGLTTFGCQNTNFIAAPGQSGGDIVFADYGATACVTLDPDNGTVTQGTNCGQLNFSGVVTTRILTTTNTSTSEIVLTGASCNGVVHRNSSASGKDFRLCAAVSDGGQLVCFVDNAGGIITIDVSSTSEHIRLEDGTNLTAGNAIDLSAGIGNKICLMSTSNTEWLVLSSKGTVSDGGAD